MWSNLRPEIKGSRTQIPNRKIIIGTQIKHMPKIIPGKVKQNFLPGKKRSPTQQLVTFNKENHFAFEKDEMFWNLNASGIWII